MSNLLVAAVAIQGIRPILWNHFGPECLPLEKQEKTGVAGHDPEEWRRSVLMTSDRQLYLEPSYVFATIRDGAKYTKKGKGSIQSAVSATLQVLDDRVLLDRYLPADPVPTNPEEAVYIDIRAVRNPSTKGRNIRYRVGAASGWKTSFRLLWDRTIVSRTELNTALIDAGKLSGIADGRAMGFGRFDVISFDVADAA